MRITRQVAKELLYEAILLAVPTAEIVLLHEHNLLLAAAHMGTGLLGAALWPPFRGVRFYILGAAVGTVVEIVCTNAGAWHYTNPSFLGIPLWLPFAWGWVTLLLRTIAGTTAKMLGRADGACQAADPC
jgi:hypothetical protein